MESDVSESPMCPVDGKMGEAIHERYVARREWLRSAIQTSKELPAGYALGLRDDSDTLAMLADFIAIERQCCSFLDFVIRIDRGDDLVWLEVVASDGMRPLLAAELGLKKVVNLQAAVTPTVVR